MGSLRSSGSAGSEKASVESVDADAACALLSTGQYGYVDVRMWEDFDAGHVAGARNVPYYLSVTPHGRPEKNDRFVDQVAALHGKEDRLIVGCRSGVRSRLAAADLVDAVRFITSLVHIVADRF
uniref:Uncharacterized protein n=1 Tax=Avena sativa TaxID=4498 RepID=A0ACD5UM10_AVESA